MHKKYVVSLTSTEEWQPQVEPAGFSAKDQVFDSQNLSNFRFRHRDVQKTATQSSDQSVVVCKCMSLFHYEYLAI